MKHIPWLVSYCKKLLLQHKQTFLPCHFGLCQTPSSEEACSVLIPVLVMIGMRCGKKSVVRVAQRVAALVPVQGSLSLFPNMYCFFDPSSAVVRFYVHNCSGRSLITWLSWDVWQIQYRVIDLSVIMVALWNRADHYIFALWFRSSFFYLFSLPNLTGRRLDVYHTSTHDVALARI